MQNFSTPERTAGGMDQSYRPDHNVASLVQNFRVDDDIGWINDRGWEPLVDPGGIGNSSVSAGSYLDTFSPVRFLSVWSRHQDAETYYLYERNGKLQYDYGNKGASSNQTITLRTERNIPKADDPGTQLVPYGRFALVINGYDAPQKFWGRAVMQPFSWTAAPPAPRCLGIDPTTVAIGGVTFAQDGTTATVVFDKNGIYGLGDPAQNAYSSFGYRCSFVSNTGSESPLSPSTTVNWQIINASAGNDERWKFGVVIQDMPVGPAGTVARKLYRTKNRKDGITGAGDVYYLVRQINENVSTTYIDITPDNMLVEQIDPATFSQPISHGYKVGAAWNGQMWLAGGEANPTKIVFSKPALPEEFPRFNYFDVGIRQGGHITSLYPFYNSLIVFRERSIDVVTVSGVLPNGDPSYTVSTLDQNIGTVASNTIQTVPGIGIIFLTRDGFYSISGGLVGGAVHQVKKISDYISKEMKRLTTGALARATAVYSLREKEYWCHYPADGSTECSRGAVLHTRNMSWSLRNGSGMAFTQLSVDPQGWIIIGLNNDPTLSKNDQTGDSSGLQVWSAHQFWGRSLAYASTNQNVYIYAVKDRFPDMSKWRSTWEDFGDSNVKKQVFSVEVEIVTSGENAIELSYGIDYTDTLISAGLVSPVQTETYNTTSAQPVYGPFASTKSPATWDKTKWTDGHITRMRWDIAAGLCSHFQFELKGNNIMEILSYKCEYRGSEQKSIVQRSKSPSNR